MNQYKKALLLAACIFLATILAQSTQAAPTAVGTVILVDFEDRQANPGGNWNTIAQANVNNTVPLVDFNTGAGTGVSYTGTNIEHYISSTAAWSENKAWVANVAADDGSNTFNRIITITFSSLAGSSYMVELVAGSNFDSDIGDYTIGGSFANRNFNGTAGVYGDDFNAQADGTYGANFGNWLIWDNVAPDAGNNIIMTIDSTQSGS